MGRAKKNVEVEAQVIARGNVVPMMTETESEETVQYVSDEDAAREDRLVSEIRMITEQTKQVVLFNSIEIGRRLTEAKAMVKRGTWGTWLKERVDYSQRTANNFMKIYQEYGRNGLAEKSQALANLSYTQALALIAVRPASYSYRSKPRTASIRRGLKGRGLAFRSYGVPPCVLMLGKILPFDTGKGHLGRVPCFFFQIRKRLRISSSSRSPFHPRLP